MGQVSVTLNGRTYRLECGEGEEAHLIALSEYLATHVETMKHKFGQVGDDRLILMASLMVTDELWEARRQLQELKGNMAELRRDRSSADESSKLLRGRSRRHDQRRGRSPRAVEPALRRSGFDTAIVSQAVTGYSRKWRAARRVRGTIPGPYKILRELTPSGTVVSDIRRPPTLVGTPGIYAPTAIAASLLSRGDPLPPRLFSKA